MKKIIPFKKGIPFKNNVAEIVSIALDDKLSLEDRIIRGNLIISGTYKMNDISVNTESFEYNIPVNIEMSDKYILDNLEISIEDFYYELVDNKLLNVEIEIGLDKLEEVKEEVNLEPIEFEVEDLEERNTVSDVKTLFDNFDESLETFATYRVCIVKEEDSIDNILINYGISKELLEQYNDISDIKVGDKLIIPYEKD